MPAGKSFSPWAFPPHDVAWLSLLPECKIRRIPLFWIDFYTCACFKFLLFSAGEFSIFSKLLYVKVNRPIWCIGKPFFNQLFYQLDLFRDVCRSPWRDVGSQVIEGIHVFKITLRVYLDEFCRFYPLPLCTFEYLIFASICIIGQVSDIGDVLHVTNLITQVSEVTDDYVKTHITLGMPNVWMVIDRRAAHIHIDAAFV